MILLEPLAIEAGIRYRPSMADGDPRYEIALEEAQTSVAEQARTVENLRTRAGTVLATASVVTGLLINRVFASDGEVNSNIGVAGWVGGAAGATSFVAVVVITVSMLWPWQGWVFARSARTIVEKYIESPQGGFTLDEVRRNLALHIDAHYRGNKRRIDRLALLFSAACILLGTEVFGFIALAVDSR